jgi:hypothetical protein
MNEYVQERRHFAGHDVPKYGAVVDPVSLGQFSLLPTFLSLVLIPLEVRNSELCVYGSRAMLLC